MTNQKLFNSILNLQPPATYTDPEANCYNQACVDAAGEVQKNEDALLAIIDECRQCIETALQRIPDGLVKESFVRTLGKLKSL